MLSEVKMEKNEGTRFAVKMEKKRGHGRREKERVYCLNLNWRKKVKEKRKSYVVKVLALRISPTEEANVFFKSVIC